MYFWCDYFLGYEKIVIVITQHDFSISLPCDLRRCVCWRSDVF